jgi:glycine/D-amino acid oxidase-like deaminating enzyme
METVDVIVVGGGLAGLSTAWHLAPDCSVLVLEQGPQPAGEASAQNAGLIRRVDLEPAERALSRRTFAWLQTSHPDWRTSPSRCTGAVLGLGRDPLHLHDAVAHLQAGGVRVQAVDSPGALSPALVDSPLVRAWYLPDEHTADPAALAQGFIAGIDRLGQHVRCDTRVEALLTDQADRVIGVRTATSEIHAGAVILAGGAWCQPLAATAGLHRPLIPLRRSVAICQTDLPASGPWIWVDDVGIYVRPEGEGWLACPCDEAVDPPAPGPGSIGTLQPTQAALLQQRLGRYFPRLGRTRISRGWTGLRTFTPDRRPMLGPDRQRPGLWWAAGLGGAGLSSCIGVGEALATWLAGSSTDWLDASSVRPDRPQLSRWPILPDGDPQGARLVSGA